MPDNLTLKEPPLPFTYEVIRCPSCDHGIDPHGLNPGDKCGVGDEYANPCPCLWSPNDIAAYLMSSFNKVNDEPNRTAPDDRDIDTLIRDKVNTYISSRFWGYLPIDLLSLVKRLLEYETTHKIYELLHDELPDKLVPPMTEEEQDIGPLNTTYLRGWDAGFKASRDECLLVLDERITWLREQ